MFTRSLSRKLSTTKTMLHGNIINDTVNKLFTLKLSEKNNDLATVSYENNNKNVYVLIESEIPETYRGQGLGKILAKKTFDYIVENNGKMKIECEFLQKFYKDNTEQYKRYKIFFYCKDKYYNLMLTTCNEALVQNSNDISLHFYHALALTLCSRYQESIRKLESLQLEVDVKLAVTVTLLYGHKLAGNEDKDVFNALDGQMRELRKQANAIDYYNTAFAMLAFRKFEKCFDYVEKSLLIIPETDTFNLKGWTLLHLYYVKAREEQVTKVFEESLQRNSTNMAAALGLSHSYLIAKDREMSLNTINKAVVRFPNVIFPLIEKMKILFSLQDWDQTIETYNRILQIDSNNLEALKLKSLILIIKDANYDDGSVTLRKFFIELEKYEVRNAKIFVENAILFSRICGRNVSVLSECYRMVEKAVQIYPNNTEYISELANQNYLANKLKEATRLYKSAIKINDANVNVLMGMTLCEMTDTDKIDNVKQQVEFITEFQEHAPSSMLYYMQAKVKQNVDKSITLLSSAFEYQMKELKNYPYSSDYLRYLDPDFMLEIVKELVKYTPQSNFTNTRTTITQNTPIFDLIGKILKTVTSACPSLKEAVFLLGKVHFIKSEYTEAAKTLQHIINNVDVTFIEAYILLSHIQIKMNLYERAAQNLEIALSHNFKVRDYPNYHLIIGLVEKHRGNVDSAIKSFANALNLMNKSKIGMPLSDKATVYIELIGAHLQLKQIHEATKLMQEAMVEFDGTSEEARITILTADHAIENKNVRQAIEMLNKITSNEPYYLEAKTKLANIYLKHRRDKRSYLQCYQEIVENTGSQGLVSLGDAYMHILEPDLALEAYQRALDTSPKDPFLMSKMGAALVHTHHFARAIKYYKETIEITGDPNLKIELIELSILLKQYENAEKMINVEIELEKNKKLDDLTALKYKTKLLILSGQVFEKMANYKGSQIKFKEARDNQTRVRRLYTVEQTVIPQEETDKAIEISVKLAELCKGLREHELAINHYKDALKLSLNNIKLLTSLAKQYMQMNYLDMCQQTCTSILNIDPDNEEASVMMADIAFRKMDFDMAQFHFIQLLNKQSTNWTALVRLVEIMRRTGKLDDVAQYLKKAEQNSIQGCREPGISFAKGLYEWYTGNLNAALRDFNNVRLDAQWGRKAIMNMIDICLNPDDEMFGDQFVDDDADYRDSRSMALNTAQRLLTELTLKPDLNVEESLQCRLLNNFLMIATKEKTNIEQALEDLISMAQKDTEQDHIGTTLAIATAYTILKQGQRAKNQLKRVSKRSWTFEDAEYLERCWLLLADFYMQASKYDLAADLLRRVLQYNKSSNKAHEYMGYIAEKEQRYREASNYLECAWKYGGKNNPIVGYRLGFNLMKFKKYAEAIDVCQSVLKAHPDYPKIKKDVLDKCMNNLRT